MKIYRRGFTLVELMVGVTIVMLIVGFGVSGMNSFLSKDKLKSVQSELLSQIKLARNYAITMQRPTGYNDQLDYVAVTIDDQGWLSIIPANINSGQGVAYVNKKIVTSETSVSTLSFGDLLFSVPEGKLLSLKGNVTPPLWDTTPIQTGQVTLEVSSENVGETRVVTINSQGVTGE